MSDLEQLELRLRDLRRHYQDAKLFGFTPYRCYKMGQLEPTIVRLSAGQPLEVRRFVSECLQIVSRELE